MADSSTPDERWLPVVGYEGLYSVSDLGRVRSLDRIVRRSGSALRRAGVMLKGSKDRHGYPTVWLARGRPQKAERVHVLVARAFLGPCPPGHEVCHGDGNRGEPALWNLRYGTRSENMRDAVRHGTNVQANRTHCPLGHEHAPWNCRANEARRGHRCCLACARARGAVQSAARRGIVLDLQAVADQKYAALREAAGLGLAS